MDFSSKSRQENELLLVRSEPDEVSQEALEEVREERGDVEFEVPPCQVEIILGLKEQQLYEILPTNVKIDLPFSGNGPFIQDPARTEIKDPLRSPMNRWLLKNIGDLAFSTFYLWLSNTELPMTERGKAYQILPKPSPSNQILLLATVKN